MTIKMSTKIRGPVFNWPPGSISVPFQDYRSRDPDRKEIITNPYSVSDPDPTDPMFLGLLDPLPDPLVRGMDPYPSIIKQKK
jgi:hypothetical protein